MVNDITVVVLGQIFPHCEHILHICLQVNCDVLTCDVWRHPTLVSDCRTMPELKMYVSLLTRLLFVEKLRSQTKQHYIALQAIIATVEASSFHNEVVLGSCTSFNCIDVPNIL